VTEAAVQVCQHPNGECAECVRNGCAGRKLHVREEVDGVAGGGDDDHGWHLLVLGLDGEGREEDVERNEEEVPVGAEWVGALRVFGGVGVDGAVNGCADGDAVAEEERVDDCEDQANGAWYDGAGLELEGGAEDELRASLVYHDPSHIAVKMHTQPGRIRAIELWAMAEKQNMLPLLMLPRARAIKLMRMVAEISKTVLYVLDSGETTSCRTPSSVPKMKMGPMSIRRALKKTDTAALARPYMMTFSQTGWRSFALMTSSRRARASSRPMMSWRTSL